MTVTTTDSSRSYTGDGASTDFPFPIYFLQPTDVKVFVDGVQLVIGYTVTGAGSPAGGSVNISPAPAIGAAVYLLRDPDTLQNTAFPPNDPFPSKASETALDKLTMLIQRIVSRVTKSLQLQDTDTSNPGYVPNALARASKILGFDANGNVSMYPVTTPVGAGNMTAEGPFIAGTHFTPGVTTSLTLSQAYGSPANVQVHFDGVYKGEGYSLAANVLNFTSPIPVGIKKVYVVGGTTLSNFVPATGSCGDPQLAWGTILSRMVDSITALKNLNGTTHSRAFVLGYYGPGTPGGGPYYADYSDTTSTDNGGTIIVALDGTRWKLAQLDWASPCQFGCLGDGSTDDSVRAQACIDAMKGKTVIRDAGRAFLVAGLTLNGTSYNGTTIRGEGKWKLRPDGGNSTFGGAWVGILYKDCVDVTTYPNWDGNRLAMTQREQIFCEGIAGAVGTRMRQPQFTETRGDCIYIGQSNWQANSTNPQDTEIEHIYHRNSALDGRNTVSVIASVGLRIAGCTARNSGGTVNGFVQPGGIDIEPDFGYQVCSDIYIGPCDITTGGTAGLGVFGKSISGVDANLDWNCFGIKIAPSKISKLGTSGSALSAGPFTRWSDATVGKMDFSYDGGVRGAGPVFDLCQRIEAEVNASLVTIGASVGPVGNATGCKFKFSAAFFDTAIVRTTGVTNSEIEVREAGGSIVASTAFGVQMHNQGRSVTQQNVTYKVHCPYDGNLSRAFRNEPGNLVTIGTGVQVHGGDWTGYPSGLACDATIPCEDVKGWTDQASVPTTGSWVAGQQVKNNAAAQGAPSAGKIVPCFIRLNTGSNNVLNTDWSLGVSTIS